MDGIDLLRDREEKIREYETFIHERLQSDLEKVLEQRDTLYNRHAKFLELRNNLLILRERDVPLKTLVDLGSHCFVKACIPDASLVYVDVGLGFHVGFTHDEALAFIDRVEGHLTTQADALTAKADHIRTHVRLMLQGVAQLRSLPSC